MNSFRVKLVFSQTLYSQSSASITMGSLAAYLRSSGREVDLCLLDTKKLHNADVILGTSTDPAVIIAKPNFKDFREMFSLLSGLKKAGLVQRIFFCGPFAVLNAPDIMSKLTWLDGIFLDQLESSAQIALSSMNSDLSSWDFKSPGLISRNAQTGHVEDYHPLPAPIPLSDLPFPARDIEQKEMVSFVNIEASRGCLFDCSFCHIPLMSEMPAKTLPINMRDPVHVVDEIEKLNKTMAKTLFIFNDSCFWSTKKDDERILLFCDEIARRKLDVHFYVYLKGDPLIGDEVLHALVKAGLVRIFLGVENSVKASLATYKKRIRPDLYESMKARLDPLGVNIHIGYIAIEPYSSLDDVLSNVEYLFHIGKLFRLGVILEPVRVVPGSSLHWQLKTEGRISSDLSFDEITYGYSFLHKEVGLLHKEWKKIFSPHALKDIAYGFEYYSTTGELLRVIATRLDSNLGLILQKHFEKFNAKKQEGMNILLEYFRQSIALARKGKVNLVGDTGYNRQFINEFTQVTEELSILYGSIVSVLKQNGGERAVSEVYLG